MLQNLALIFGALAIILFLFPTAYRCVVAWLPSSYYKIGSLGDPDRSFSSFPTFPVDLAAVDNHSGEARLAHLLADETHIARLPREEYIPGRNDPRASDQEKPGRTWEGGECLYINDFLFRAIQLRAELRDYVAVDQVEPGEDGVAKIMKRAEPRWDLSTVPILPAENQRRLAASFLSIKASEVREQASKRGRTDYRDYFIEGVLRELQTRGDLEAAKPMCNSEGEGRRCPRIEIWAEGTVAPCTIRPF